MPRLNDEKYVTACSIVRIETEVLVLYPQNRNVTGTRVYEDGSTPNFWLI